MTSNYDPKPGRWMLPLVVLAMVAFTYLFVRELPSAATASSVPDETNGTGVTTTTGADGVTTTTTPVVLDPETQAYLDTLGGFQTRLVDMQGQLAAANTSWDASPRTITFDQAQSEFSAVAQAASSLAAEVQALTPPENLAAKHTAAVQASALAADAANAALVGLRAPSPDTGEGRRAAVADFDNATNSFAEALTAASTAASSN